MTDLRDRLSRCFATIFPEAKGLVADATPDTLPRWDSTNHILLIQVVEDEFGITIPETSVGDLLSFAEFESYLRSKVPSA